MRTRVLLTGGGGMVGRNFLEHRAAERLEVLAPRRDELDLLDFEAVEAYLRERKPDVVVHAAGRIGGIQANVKEPVRFLLENLDMGRNVVWAARRAGVKRLLNVASSSMYPREAPNPLEESALLTGAFEPTNEGYALAKAVVVRLCEYVSREDDSFQYKSLVPCNMYGRHDRFDPAASHLVAGVIRRLHEAKEAGAPAVAMWGDGTARREFMYAGDFADCLIEAVERFDSLPATMNVGPGEDAAVADYYALAAEAVGYRGSFVPDASKPVGMARKLLSVEKARRWGWRTKTSLRDGIAMTYEFFRAARSRA